MRRILPLVLSLSILGTSLMAQVSGTSRPSVNPLKDLAIPRQVAGDRLPPAVKPANPSVSAKVSVTETIIGATRYDLQTNTSTQNRFWVFEDGTAGATWTMGMNDPGYADRGTGYNYFDGTAWGAIPTTRIEGVRTGWPSYMPYQGGGEMVVCHDFSTTSGGLVISSRAAKGSGNWSSSYLYGPAGHEDVAWPRAITGGDEYDAIHAIYLTKSTVNLGGPYQGLEGALLYSRSTDGGTTWNPHNLILPGMDTASNYGFGGDSYTWAAPMGDTIAFVVGDSWSDLYIMKSTDGGSTWNKIMVWENPYPKFNLSNLIVTDTFYCPDGAASLAFDKDGKLHLCFGVNRAHSDGAGTFWFPFVDGIAYWNEDMPPFTSSNFKYTLDPDSLYNSGHLVAWTQDINQNDTLDFLPGTADVIGRYFISLSSMPNILVDDNGRIALVYSSVTEGYDNGIQNYRHVWFTVKDAANGWTEYFEDLTASILHNYDECIYPTIAPGHYTFDGNEYKARFIFQADEEPGLSVRGDEDAATDNSIIHSEFTYWWTVGIPEHDLPSLLVGPLYPNPASQATRLEASLARPADLTLRVTDLSGRTVLHKDHGRKAAGEHIIELDLSGFAPGLYVVNLGDGHTQAQRKLIVR